MPSKWQIWPKNSNFPPKFKFPAIISNFFGQIWIPLDQTFDLIPLTGHKTVIWINCILTPPFRPLCDGGPAPATSLVSEAAAAVVTLQLNEVIALIFLFLSLLRLLFPLQFPSVSPTPQPESQPDAAQFFSAALPEFTTGWPGWPNERVTP